MARNHILTPATVLISAAAIGVAIGLGPALVTPEGRQQVANARRSITVATGMERSREPRAGDFWRRCDDARAAGTAPIYRGEPGYRSAMDGDDDGIACEPYHGG